jgi:hypothetical protein
VSKRDYVQQELADIEAQLADKNPDTVGEDLPDLAAVGLARYDQTTTPEQIAELVAEARRRGRSWDQIGNRLGMSGEEARKEYGHGSGGLRAAIVASGVAGAVVVVLRLIRNLSRMPHA